MRGPGAWEIARALFRPRSQGTVLPETPAGGRFWLGKIDDDVVLSVKSIEPWPWVEIHCHGGLQIVQLLMEALREQGATPCTWAEFIQHTESTASRAAAAVALAKALTLRTAAILLDQVQGAWDRVLADLLTDCRTGAHESVGRKLSELHALADLGSHLTAPWQVVVAGPANVGKSSLVNALVGYERCIVAATPGTTRDVVTTTIALGGWPVALADTAGLREDGDSTEHAGMHLARSALEEADCCLWVVDASEPPLWSIGNIENCLVVINKIDLPAAWDISRTRGALRVSARTGEGLGRLVEELTRRLVPKAPAPGSAVPFTEELRSAITAALHFHKNGAIEGVAGILGSTVCGQSPV
jgi:tRNA modification GTPase